MCLLCGKYVCLLTLTLSLREEKYDANILILPTLGCVLAWLMASRPGNSDCAVVARKLSVCVESKAAERSHCWGLENKILGVRDECEGWTLSVHYNLGRQCEPIGSLHELIGFGLVADSSSRGPEGFDSEVGWEGTSGVVVLFGHFFHPSCWDVYIGSKPVHLILSHSS